MRVLFTGAKSQPEHGGAYGFMDTIIKALDKGLVRHEIVERPEDAEFVWFLSPHYFEVKQPFAMTVWDLGHRELPWFPEVSLSGWTFDQRETFYSHVLPRASRVITGTDTGRRALQDFYRIPYQHIEVIPLPVEVPSGPFEPVEGLEPRKYIYYPAQFWPHKNHITLIDMMRHLDGYTLVFTGADKGNESYVRSYAEREAPGRVRFLGFVGRDVVNSLYFHCHCCVFASLLGPDNLPPLEAAALGCPVVRVGLNPHLAATEVRMLRRDSHPPKPFSGYDYVERIQGILDRFAPIRKLWGREYQHS